MRERWGVGLGLVGLLAAVPAIAQDEPQGEDAALDADGAGAGAAGARVRLSAEIDARRTADGVLGMELRYEGIDPAGLRFKPMGDDYTIERVELRDGQGRSVPVELRKGQYEAVGLSGDVAVLRYDVRPGGIARHGHQGYASAEFAVADGRIFLLPRGFAGVGEVRVRALLPEGWSLAGPFRADGEAWSLDWWGDAFGVHALVGACLAVGPFAQVERQYGDSALRVFTYRPWEDGHEALLVDKSVALYEAFREHFGFRSKGGAPYAVVWTPLAADGERIFGGSSASGACFEQPTDRFRNWLLLGHRFAHAMNKYVPTGYWTADRRDHWYMEGWASWAEVEGARLAGLESERSYFSDLFDRYLERRWEDPRSDLPLAQESLSEADEVDFLHYVKAPLVTAMLDGYLQREAGKGLTAWSRQVAEERGHYQGALAVREELGRWSGVALEPFWQAFVDGQGAVVPVWPGYVTEAMRTPRAPVAHVGEMPVDEQYLAFLSAKGGFERYADVLRFVEDEAWHRARLAAAGVELASPELRASLHGAPPEARWMLALAEAAWPTAPLVAKGKVARSLVRAPLRWAPGPVAEVFGRLLAEEEVYLRSQVKGGVRAVTLREPRGEDYREVQAGLVVAGEQQVVLVTDWLIAPERAEFEVSRDGVVTLTKAMVMEPGWARTFNVFEAGARPAGAGWITFRVIADGEVLAQRSFWQR